MQRERHLEYIARDAVSKVVQNSKQVEELPLPKSVKEDIIKYIETPRDKKQLEKWFGCQVRRKALYYWCPTSIDHLLTEDIERYKDPSFDFHYVNIQEIAKLDDSFYSKGRETRQFLIFSASSRWIPRQDHLINRMISGIHCTDLVILSHIPPEIFFLFNVDTLKQVLTVQREYCSPKFSLSSILIRHWFENRPHRKALYYWCLNFDIEPYLDITRYISDRSQIYVTFSHLNSQTSYPENCQFIIVDDFFHVSEIGNQREFLMRAITKQYDELLDEETGNPCQFKHGADIIFISYIDPKDSFGSDFSKDYLDLVIQDELFDLRLQYDFSAYLKSKIKLYKSSPPRRRRISRLFRSRNKNFKKWRTHNDYYYYY